MWTKQKRRTRLGRFIVPGLTVCFLCYFGYHLYHGEYGLYSRSMMENQIILLTEVRDNLILERRSIENRIALLRDGTIEKDMLDEYARRMLNLVSPGELILMIKNENEFSK